MTYVGHKDTRSLNEIQLIIYSKEKKGESDQRVGRLPMLQFPQVSALHAALAPQEAGFKGLLVHLPTLLHREITHYSWKAVKCLQGSKDRDLTFTSQGCFLGRRMFLVSPS